MLCWQGAWQITACATRTSCLPCYLCYINCLINYEYHFVCCVVFVSFSIAVVFGYPTKAGLRNWLCCWPCPSVMMNERRRVCCYLSLDCVRGRWQLLLWMCTFCLQSASAWLQPCTIYFPLQMVLMCVVLRTVRGVLGTGLFGWVVSVTVCFAAFVYFESFYFVIYRVE